MTRQQRVFLNMSVVPARVTPSLAAENPEPDLVLDTENYLFADFDYWSHADSLNNIGDFF